METTLSARLQRAAELAREIEERKRELDMLVLGIADPGLPPMQPAQPTQSRRPIRRVHYPKPIRDYILEVLSTRPGGTCRVITKEAQIISGINIPSRSISAALSTMKGEGILENNGEVWLIKKDAQSEPQSGQASLSVSTVPTV